MKKFTKVVAAVMALTMAMGMMVSAASSSTTSNSSKHKSSSSSTAVAYSNYVVYRSSAATSSRAAVVNTGATQVRVSSDYNSVTDNSIIATAIAADETVAAAVTDAVAAAVPGKTVVGPIKVQFYKQGVAGQTGFGTFNAVVNVPASYNGQTVTVFVFNQDGTGSVVNAVVTNGRVAVALTQGATIAIAL